MKNPVKTFWEKADKGISKALASVTVKIRDDIRDLILARQTPRGGRQYKNADLSGDGILADKDKYRIYQENDKAWVIFPPPERASVIEYLRQKGYVLFEIPKSAPKWLEDLLKKELP
jgi:hypothetical protein